ncbi:helix-turn-helix domain-containing protein [Mogibacterium timidum]|nr:helix-turn-helix domain-containing protein [Mogibacterium timidum]
MITGCGYNVSESAFAVGYSNLSHFSKVFKIKFGISPGKIARKTQS